VVSAHIQNFLKATEILLILPRSFELESLSNLVRFRQGSVSRKGMVLDLLNPRPMLETADHSPLWLT